jgi:hypothetical protein
MKEGLGWDVKVSNIEEVRARMLKKKNCKEGIPHNI